MCVGLNFCGCGSWIFYKWGAYCCELCICRTRISCCEASTEKLQGLALWPTLNWNFAAPWDGLGMKQERQDLILHSLDIFILLWIQQTGLYHCFGSCLLITANMNQCEFWLPRVLLFISINLLKAHWFQDVRSFLQLILRHR